VPTVLAQIPEPKDGESAWQWVAVLLAFFVFIGGGAAFKLLADAWGKVSAFHQSRGDEWKQRADMCLVEQGKTGDALKLANDATERLAKLVVDGGTRVETKIDSNAKAIDALARDVARLLDRPSDQGTPSRRS
jgi:hypothetical protein